MTSTSKKNFVAVAMTLAAFLLVRWLAGSEMPMSAALSTTLAATIIGLAVAAIVVAVLAVRDIRGNRTGVVAYAPPAAVILLAASLVGALVHYGVGHYRDRVSAASEYGTWSRFTSRVGDYSVFVTGPAQETTQTVQRPEGAVTIRAVAASSKPGEGYSVTVADARSAGSSVNERLDLLEGEFVQRSKGRLVARSDVMAGPVAGRDLRVLAPKNALHVRLFAVNDRVYQVLVLRPVDDGQNVLDERFLDSFNIHAL